MRKNVALLLALVMILSVIPMTAFAQDGAASYTRITSVQNVGRAPGFEWPNDARIEVEIPGGALTNAETDVLYVEIPSGLNGDFSVSNEANITVNVYESVSSFEGRQEIRLDVTSTDDDEDLEFRLNFTNLENGSRLSGDDVNISFDSPVGSVFGSTDVMIARITDGNVNVSVRDVNIVTDAGDMIGDIRVTEDQAGALDTSMEIKLPRGFYWIDEDATATTRWGNEDLEIELDDQIGTTGNYQTVVFSVDEQTITAGSWDVAGLRIKVDSTLAQYGEIEADVSDAAPSTLVVAVYGDYLAEVTGVTNPHLLAGRINERLGRFEIEELVGGTLVENRTITMTLPSGVKWDVDEGELVTPPEVRTADSDNYDAFEDMNWEVIDLAGRTIRGRVDEGTRPASDPAVVVFNGPRVAIEPGFEGDLTVSFGGSAGVGGEVVLAEVTKPVAAESMDTTNVRLGVQSQPVGDIVITEAKAEALERGNTLVLEPVWDGVRFAATPTVEVEGDIIIEEIWMAPNGDRIMIEISADSDQEASEITISNLYLSLDRVLPEGELQLEVKGDALIDTLIHTRTTRSADSVDAQNPYFSGSDVSSVVSVANVVTPADDAEVDVERAQVAFTVGSTTYMVDGEPMMMDVAPFISNDRLMIPVRYLEDMFGMQPNWNEASRTVTVLFDGDVYGMAIGSNMITMNGADYMEMDATAEIVNERTFVPASRFARAMGVDYEWDAMTNTATFN